MNGPSFLFYCPLCLCRRHLLGLSLSLVGCINLNIIFSSINIFIKFSSPPLGQQKTFFYAWWSVGGSVAFILVVSPEYCFPFVCPRLLWANTQSLIKSEHTQLFHETCLWFLLDKHSLPLTILPSVRFPSHSCPISTAFASLRKVWQ